MQIYILKNNQQFGPYSLEQVQGFVKQGGFLPTDMAWYTGAATWGPLAGVPGVATALPGSPARSPAARPEVAATGSEEIFFEGTEAQVLNLGTLIGSGLLFLIVSTISLLFFWMAFPVAFLFLIPAVAAWMKSMNAKCRITNQRISTEQGVFFKRTGNLELYRVKDISVEQPFFLRLFGRGNIVVLSGDTTTPRLNLRAIPRPKEVAEKLRTATEVRRRTTGVREIEHM